MLSAKNSGAHIPVFVRGTSSENGMSVSIQICQSMFRRGSGESQLSVIGNPDDGWWYLDYPDSLVLERINELMAPLAHKSRQKPCTGISQALARPSEKVRRSKAKQASWHYDKGRKHNVIYAEGGAVLLARDAELKERPQR